MPYRLEVNQGGTTGEYIKLPSMSFDKFIIDASWQHNHATQKSYFDFRTGFSFGYINRTTGGVDAEGNDSPMSTYVDGAGPKVNNTVMVPTDTRCLLEVRWSAVGTDDGNVFTNSGASAGTFMPAKVWDIKFYSGATLTAHYDLTLGNVNDQSGNGRHATLFGGEFIDEGGGGPTVHEVEGAASSISAATSSVVKVAAVGGQAASTSAATSSYTFRANVSGAASAVSSVASAVGRIIPVGGSAAAASSASGDVGGSGQVHEVGGAAASVSSATSSVVRRAAVGGLAAAVAGATSSVVRLIPVGGTALSTSSASFIDGDPLARRLTLKGSRRRFLTLKGSRNQYRTLRGGIMAEINQDIEMYAGESIDITIPPKDEAGEPLPLAGASVKWILVKKLERDQILLVEKTLTIAGDNVKLILDKADTNELSKGIYHHAAEIIDALGKENRLFSGRLTIIDNAL